MHLLISNSHNPFWNLAVEEYLLKTNKYECPIVFLWRNENTIVVGRNQNLLAEINLEAAEKDQVKIVRRNTGGGTVFHDLGNLCFTLLAKKQNLSSTEVFRQCLNPIINLLRYEGLDVAFSGRNDLEIDGFKISGNAQLQTQTKTLSHGTILYDVELTKIQKYLHVNPLKLKSKKVKSVQARVKNIKNFLPDSWTIEQFIEKVALSYTKNFQTQELFLDSEDLKIIDQLVEQKYLTWEWNFGKNESFQTTCENYWPGIGLIQASLNTQDGLIVDLKFQGDFIGSYSSKIISKSLEGKKFRVETIETIPSSLLQNVFGENMNHEKLIELLFQ